MYRKARKNFTLNRRSIASLLEKIIADYLSKEGISWEKASSYHDRRQHPRKDVSLPARLTIKQAPEIYEETEALVENMSLGGSFVTYTNGHRSSWKLQSSIHLLVRIPRFTEPLELACRAVRVIRDEQKVIEITPFIRQWHAIGRFEYLQQAEKVHFGLW